MRTKMQIQDEIVALDVAVARAIQCRAELVREIREVKFARSEPLYDDARERALDIVVPALAPGIVATLELRNLLVSIRDACSDAAASSRPVSVCRCRTGAICVPCLDEIWPVTS